MAIDLIRSSRNNMREQTVHLFIYRILPAAPHALPRPMSLLQKSYFKVLVPRDVPFLDLLT